MKKTLLALPLVILAGCKPEIHLDVEKPILSHEGETNTVLWDVQVNDSTIMGTRLKINDQIVDENLSDTVDDALFEQVFNAYEVSIAQKEYRVTFEVDYSSSGNVRTISKSVIVAVQPTKVVVASGNACAIHPTSQSYPYPVTCWGLKEWDPFLDQFGNDLPGVTAWLSSLTYTTDMDRKASQVCVVDHPDGPGGKGEVSCFGVNDYGKPDELLAEYDVKSISSGYSGGGNFSSPAWCALGEKDEQQDVICWSHEDRYGLLSESDAGDVLGYIDNIWAVKAGHSSLCVGYLVEARRRFDCFLMTGSADQVQLTIPAGNWFSGAWDVLDFTPANYYTVTTYVHDVTCYIDEGGAVHCFGDDAHLYSFAKSGMSRLAYYPGNTSHMMCQYSDDDVECSSDTAFDYGDAWTNFFLGTQPYAISTGNHLGACGVIHDSPDTVECTASGNNQALSNVPAHLAAE